MVDITTKMFVFILALFFMFGCSKIDTTKSDHKKKDSPYVGTSIEHMTLHPSQKELERKIVSNKLDNNGFEILVENSSGIRYFYQAVYITGNKTECTAYKYYYDVFYKRRKLDSVRCEFISNAIEKLLKSKIGVFETNEQRCYDCSRDVFVYFGTANEFARILLKNVNYLDNLTDGCNGILYDYIANVRSNKKDTLIHKCLEYSMPEYACDESTIASYERNIKQFSMNETKCKLYSDISALNDVVMAR